MDVIYKMKQENSYWKEFIEDGETIIKINLYERFHLKILTRYLNSLRKKRVPKDTKFGSFRWSVLEFLKFITKYTSSRSLDLFWFRVEAAWILKSSTRKRLGFNCYEVTFTRKDHINPSDIRMNFKSYKTVNELRKHI